MIPEHTTLTVESSSIVCRPDHKLLVQNLSVDYGNRRVLNDINMVVCRGCVTAIIGPSGCGKTTFLMALNRLLETVPGARTTGRVLLDGVNILGPSIRAQAVRRRVGLIFQKPNPFPLSVFNNIALGLREHGMGTAMEVRRRVEEALQSAGLWDEVKDRLGSPALALSGGQQQRLCIARAIALKPEVLLMDEPCSALDPVSGGRVEELVRGLASRFTVLIVTHNLPQARRLSDQTAFFYPRLGHGELFEAGPTKDIFESPRCPETRDYVSGRAG